MEENITNNQTQSSIESTRYECNGSTIITLKDVNVHLVTKNNKTYFKSTVLGRNVYM